MKIRTIQFVVSFTCLISWTASVSAATKYWDIDGATPGAGDAAPGGAWDAGVTANWSTSAAGNTAAATWADGDDAVFSAGTDATGSFVVILDPDGWLNQVAGDVTVEEGSVNITANPGVTLSLGNNVPGKGNIHVAAGALAEISAKLEYTSGDDNNTITKTGTGTLTLSGANLGYGGAVVVREGLVRAANTAATPGWGIISNGAALHIAAPATGLSMGAPVILNGNGIDNSGAFRSTTSANVTFTAGANLESDARIHSDGGEFNWALYPIKGTNGGNNFNLTIGGNGGRVRLNQTITIPGHPDAHNRSLQLGTGTVTKEGNCLLQLENPSICSAFIFKGGTIYPRYPAFGTNSTIFIEGGGGTFAALFQNITLDQHMLVAAGATVGFNCNRVETPVPASYNFVCNGVISGLGNLSKTNPGTLFLNNANTYSGHTIIQFGPTALGAAGSISNSTVIDVWIDATLDVTAKAGGFVLQPGQTLKGNGTVLGNMTAKGTLAPGASVGSLTNDGDLTLAGTVLIDVDKSLSPGASNDLITVTGSLSHSGGGAVSVVNLGPTLAVGDSFKLFNQAVTGGQTMSVTGGGAVWTNKLAVDGSIAVLAAAPPAVPATNLTIQAVGPTSRSLGGQGAANSAYQVYASTNVALPMASWWLLGTTNSSGGGVIQFLDAQATNAQRFYRFGQPSP